MWREMVAPLVLLEFVSGDGSEERDTTPETGKFWVYERVIRPAFYGIFEALQNRIEMYRHVEDHFVRMEPNLHGRYPIPQLGLELGLTYGSFLNMTLPWMRWWDADGKMLLIGHELAEQEKQRTSDWQRGCANSASIRTACEPATGIGFPLRRRYNGGYG